MKKRRSILAYLITIAFTVLLVTAVYVKGKYDGKVGNDFSMIDSAIAAQSKPTVSPVKSRGGTWHILPQYRGSGAG